MPELPYKHSIANRPIQSWSYQNDQYERFGLIRPDEDPGLPEELADLRFSPKLTREQIVQLNQESRSDLEGFEQNFHLPKGVFDPTAREYDPNKENLVINYTEDDHPQDFLRSLDEYFKLDVPEVKSIKDQYNVFVAWSTSMEDSIKALTMVKNKIGDLAKASVLFLADANINKGTGPNSTIIDFTSELDDRGPYVVRLMQHLFNLNPSKIRTFIQTSSDHWWSSLEDLSNMRGDWENYSEADTQNAISQFAALLQKRGNMVGADKLHHSGVKAASITIQSFLRSLHQ